MLYELYKKIYFYLYDNLIICLLHFLLIILKMCASLQSGMRSRRPLCLSAPLAFTNTPPLPPFFKLELREGI